MKTRKGFLDGYRTYDRNHDAPGSPDQWRRAFNERMGYAEAEEILKTAKEIPCAALLKAAKTLPDLKKAYRDVIRRYHPDIRKPEPGLSQEQINREAQEIVALYTKLEAKF